MRKNETRTFKYLTVFLLSLIITGCASVNRTPTNKLPKPRHGSVYIVAHRGAHNGIPENTLAAYETAIEMGVDFVEIDLRTTKDGRIVSIHNKDIDSYVTNGQHGLVSEMTLEQLKQLDIGSRIGPEWSDERIPTFEEILKLCKGRVGIYLDLKDASVDKVVSMINKYGMARHILWYADSDELERIAELCPDCILMPDPGPEENLPEVIERFKPSVVASVWRYYSRSFADKCHQAHAIVIVDESGPACWEQALEWNTDGIQTNQPAQLISLLEHRKR